MKITIENQFPANDHEGIKDFQELVKLLVSDESLSVEELNLKEFSWLDIGRSWSHVWVKSKMGNGKRIAIITD